MNIFIILRTNNHYFAKVSQFIVLSAYQLKTSSKICYYSFNSMFLIIRLFCIWLLIRKIIVPTVCWLSSVVCLPSLPTYLKIWIFSYKFEGTLYMESALCYELQILPLFFSFSLLFFWVYVTFFVYSNSTFCFLRFQRGKVISLQIRWPNLLPVYTYHFKRDHSARDTQIIDRKSKNWSQSKKTKKHFDTVE